MVEGLALYNTYWMFCADKLCENGYFCKSQLNPKECILSVIPLNDKSLITGLEVQRQLYKKFGIQAELNEIGASLDAAKCDLSFGQVKAYFNSPISVLVQFMPFCTIYTTRTIMVTCNMSLIS